MARDLRMTRRIGLATIATFAALLTWGYAHAGVSLSSGGYLDSDIWSDLKGNFYTNDELDLGTIVSFGDSGKVQAHVYTTVRGGVVPAGYGEPADRWVALLFDGVDITFTTPIGSFAVGDLAYQYGKFSYYFYKRQSMITPESFTRGLKWSLERESFSTSILAGAADTPDEILGFHYVVQSDSAGDTLEVLTEEALASEGNAADLGGSTTIGLGSAGSLSLYYGLRSDMKIGFKESGLVYGGLEYKASFFEEALGVKFDLGVRSLPGAERATLVSLLLEPSLKVGKFSVAATYYQVIDPDETGASLVGEDMFVYLEPGFSFTDMVAAGLPLELHANGPTSELADNGAFWVVPTLYVYPFEKVQWWLWGQAVVPLGEGDVGFGLGSEIIVEF